jgi:hypothetical protein
MGFYIKDFRWRESVKSHSGHVEGNKCNEVRPGAEVSRDTWEMESIFVFLSSLSSVPFRF